MPRGKSHGPSIKDDRQYEALRDQGMSKEKAARIANESAATSRSTVARRGGKAQDYDDRRPSSSATAPRRSESKVVRE